MTIYVICIVLYTYTLPQFYSGHEFKNISHVDVPAAAITQVFLHNTSVYV